MDPSGDPKVSHWGWGRQTMFTNQVSRPVDSLDPPSWPPSRASRANSKKDLVTGPIRGFCALHLNPETVPMMSDGSLLRSGGETWGPVSPDNVHETGVSLHRGRQGGAVRANAKKDLVKLAIRGFCALQAELRTIELEGPGCSGRATESTSSPRRTTAIDAQILGLAQRRSRPPTLRGPSLRA